MQLRPLSLVLHKYLGLASGIVIMIVGLTGAFLVFAGPIDRAMHRELWEVPAGGEGGQMLSPDSILAVVQSNHPDREVRSIGIPTEAGRAYAVAFHGGREGLAVYVHPSSGDVLGEREYARTLIGIMEGLHTSLLLGKAGLFAVIGSTIILLFLLLTGYVLWWPRTKTESRRSFTVKWTAGWKRLVYDSHNVIGFYASWYLLLIVFSGLLLSFPIFTAAVYRITGDGPPPPPRSQQVEGAQRIPLSEAVRVAAAAVADGTVTSVSVPNRPRQAIRVQVRAPARGARGRRTVYVDQFSGEMLRVDRPEARPLTRKLLDLTVPIHTGTVLGLPTEIIAFLASLVGGVLPLTGFLIWYPRWRAKQKRG